MSEKIPRRVTSDFAVGSTRFWLDFALQVIEGSIHELLEHREAATGKLPNESELTFHLISKARHCILGAQCADFRTTSWLWLARVRTEMNGVQ
jgi:hypothetical protein